MAVDIRPDKLKRNPEAIKKLFTVTNTNTIANDNLSIIFPERFIPKYLANLDKVCEIACYYAVLDTKGNYGVVIAPTTMQVMPTRYNRSCIDGINYIVLEFDKNATFMVTNELVQDAEILYRVVDELFINGNVPWYLNYEDVSLLFAETQKYTGNKIGNNPMTFEIITSLIARDPNNDMVQFKNSLKKQSDVIDKKPIYVGLQDIFRSYTDTGSKLVGSYLGQGITNAIVEPETKTSEMSDILRA